MTRILYYINFSKYVTNASIAQWQSVGLVNQRSWVQSSLEAKNFFQIFGKTLTVTQIVACRQYLRQKCKKIIFDPDVIWTRSLLIWSQTRYRCATESLYINIQKYMTGSTEIWTRIAGFKVQSANHYTIEPYLLFHGIKLKWTKYVHGESNGYQFWWEQHHESNSLVIV